MSHPDAEACSFPFTSDVNDLPVFSAQVISPTFFVRGRLT